MTPFQRCIDEIQERMKKLGYNLEQLKFADGFTSYVTLLRDIKEGKLREDLTAFQKLAEYFRIQQNTLKQGTLAKKLSEFSADYRRNNNSGSTKQVVKQVTTNVEASIHRAQDLYEKLQRNAFMEKDEIYQRIRSYKNIMDIIRKETDTKRKIREGIINKFRNLNIFTYDELEFLSEYSNFSAFCNKMPS